MPIDNTKYVEDNYLRPEEVDARNTARLMAVLDKWEMGKYESIWLVLHDVYEIVEWINPLSYQSVHQRYPDGNNDWAQGYIQKEQERFSSYIKPVFLDNLNSDDVKSALKEFKRRLDDAEGDLTSFAIGSLIFDSVSIDGDGGKNPESFSKLPPAIQNNFGEWHHWANKQSNPFHGMIASLKVRELAFKNPKKKVDLFHFDGPEPESAFRKRLEPHIAELRAWSKEQGITGHIIANITADASGSVAFRPHVFYYNFLRDCPEKDALFEKEADNPSRYPEDRFFDFKGKEFDPKHSFHKEYIYPYPVVYVTTYALTFVPKNPDDSEHLKMLLQKAFEILEGAEQRFGYPIHYSSAQKYKRPNPQWLTEKDGAFPIKDRVDLDDFYNLYYLLENMIVLSASIAQTLNAATLLEARSPIKTANADSCGEIYSIDNSPRIDQIGEVYGLERGLEDLFQLYALGRLDEKGFVQQTMNMADMALMGQIPNQSKALLTYEGMEQRAESEGRDVVPYAIAL